MFTRYILGLLYLILPIEIFAQQSLWNGTRNAKMAASTKHKIKDFKQHLEIWGLDSNYNRAFLLGGKLNSNGWSGGFYIVRRNKYNTSNIWQFCLSEIKHDKQTKQEGTNGGIQQLGNSSPYVFGKINNLYTVQIGYSTEKLLLPAVVNGNLSLSIRYGGGASVALLKPYYLRLIYEDPGGATTSHIEEHYYSTDDSAKFLNRNSILGAAKWQNGLSDIRYVPGIYAETSFVITPGKNKYFFQVVTLGCNGSFYAKPLAIMADIKANKWVVCVFAGLAIGERWIR